MTVKLAVIESQTYTAQRVDSDHEARLRTLEWFRWVWVGAASVVGASAGVIAALLTSRGH